MRTTVAGSSLLFSLAPSLVLFGCDAMAPEQGTPPSVTAIVPDLGSTSGGTPVEIVGTGLSGATVMLGGIRMSGGQFDDIYQLGSMYTETPPHAAGNVDLVVTGPSGGTTTLPKAFTYAPPQAFDFNGEWAGWAGETWLAVTIRDNALVSVSCEGLDGGTLPISPPPAVRDGAFSYLGDDGFAISARIVSASSARGDVTVSACGAHGRWDLGRWPDA